MIRNVIIKANAGKHVLWIAQRYLVAQAGVSEDYLWKVARPSASKSPTAAWQWCKMEGEFYYRYDAIPDRAPKHYRSALPSSEELTRLARRPFNDEEVLARAAQKWENEVAKEYDKKDLEYFMYESSPTFSYDKAEQLAQGVAWSRLLFGICRTQKWIRYGLDSTAQAYDLGAKVLSEKNLLGMKLTTGMSLRHRLQVFPGQEPRAAQRESLISGKYGNDNRRIVGKAMVVDYETGEMMPFDIHQAVMFSLWMNIGKSNKEYKIRLHKKYKNYMLEAGQKAVEYRTFCAHTDDLYNKVFMSKERDGNKAFNNAYKTYVPCLPLQYSNSLWVADGSGTKLKYAGTGSDGKPKVKTLYMVRINDVASRALLGYSISDKGETAEMVETALRMAIEISEGLMPLDFLSDNGGSFTEKTIKEKLTVLLPKVRTIQVGNSQENPAEMFVRMMTDMGRDQDNWSNTGFNAKTVAHHANPDYMDINKLPNREEAYLQMLDIIDKWNYTAGADGFTPMERYRQNLHAESKLCTAQQYRFAFGHKTEIALGLTRGFVRVNHQGKQHLFTIENYETQLELISAKLGHTGDGTIQVRWLPETPGTPSLGNAGCYAGADIYTPEGAFIMSCLPTSKAHKSEAEATSQTYNAMGALSRRKADMNERADFFKEGVAASLMVAQAQSNNVGSDSDAETEVPTPMKYDEQVAYAPKKRVKDAYNADMENVEAQQYTKKTKIDVAKSAFDDL